MADAKKLLDALVGASSQPGAPGKGVQASATGGQLAALAKDFVNRNPGLAEAAVMSIAGLLLGKRQGRGVARGFAGLGGLALIGGLAYKAVKDYRAGKPALGAPEAAPGSAVSGAAAAAASLPGSAAFDPAHASEDDALLFARAMVAAASADGRVDEAERARIVSGLAQAGLDDEAGRWLERELASPATIDELADPIEAPEKAAQLYAAARVAIDPDTMQEREFLRQLAEALDLDPQLRTHLDDAAAGIKSGLATGV
jgi:uncharacterized membrane protein YebE (DUF533 family)